MENFIYLTIHILFALGMFISLKVINIKSINTYQAIAINYIVAMIFTAADLYFQGYSFYLSTRIIIPSVFVATLFVSTFVVMILSTERVGIGLSTALNKMAVVIPVSVGIIFLGQDQNIIFKIIGVLLAILSFFFILYKKERTKSNGALLLPLSVFLLSGMIDTSMELTHRFALKDTGDDGVFLVTVFIFSVILSLVAVFFEKKKNHNLKLFPSKVFGYGAMLGVFNYLASKMILINVAKMGGSIVFPIHNTSIVMLTALTGAIFFKEKFSRKQWFGIALAVVSVLIVASTM